MCLIFGVRDELKGCPNVCRMKRFVLLIFIAVFSITARSQVIISLLFGDKLNSEKITFGLLVGNGWNYLSDYNTSGSLSKFNLGLYLNFRLNEKLFLQFDAMAKYNLGAKKLPVYSLGDVALDSLFATGSVERNSKYFALIPTIQYRFFSNFNFEIGTQISMRLKSTDVFSVGRTGGDLKFEKKITDMSTLFDIGATGGISYQIGGSGVKIGARYYYGFIDIFSADEGHNANTSIQLSGYIPIGRKKALERQQKTETKQ